MQTSSEAESLKLKARVKLELTSMKVRVLLELLRSTNRARETRGPLMHKHTLFEASQVLFGSSHLGSS